MGSIYGHNAVGSLKTLLSAGIDVDAKNKDYYAALHLVNKYNDLKLIYFKLLICAGASVNICNCVSITPLHDAVLYNDTDRVTILLNAGAINAKDISGTTPLMYAMRDGHRQIYELLSAATD